ncbi:diguanylate cyclase [mine drainage metagenome]|uniref:Diguanylate cyclase n=1 Tax=mine drainage metagenome TaxID=410659 RepID=A0A1J5PS16_9ZZZZ
METAHSIVERIRAELEGLVLAHAGDVPVKVTASFGIAGLETAITIEESIDRADHALYAAKKAGRNRVCTWGLDEIVASS